MKSFLLLITAFIIISGCKTEPEFLPADQIEKEKAAVIKVCNDYNKASEAKSWSAMVETLAEEVKFFGTDSSEVIKTFPEFKKKMLEQWQQYDKMIYGEMVDVEVLMDRQGTIASIFFGVPVYLQHGNDSIHYFLRGARTLKKDKEKNRWFIVSGLVGIVRSNNN